MNTESRLTEAMVGVSETKRRKLLKQRLKTMTDAMPLIPDNAEVQMKLGSIYKDLDNMEMAEQHLSKAISLDQHFLVAIINLAAVKNLMGDVAVAEKLYRKVIGMNPNLWDVYAQLGDFLLKHDRAGEAVHMYKKGTEIEPNTMTFWYRLKYAQEISGDMEAAQATQTAIEKREQKLNK